MHSVPCLILCQFFHDCVAYIDFNTIGFCTRSCPLTDVLEVEPMVVPEVALDAAMLGAPVPPGVLLLKVLNMHLTSSL